MFTKTAKSHKDALDTHWPGRMEWLLGAHALLTHDVTGSAPAGNFDTMSLQNVRQL